jgi:hypothetical protein
VRINNYSQLDWQSGKAPDFEEKDPLASLFVCPTQGVTSIRRFQFRKRAQFFISTHNETLFRPYDRATVGVLVAVGAAVCVAVAVAVDVANAVAVAVGRGVGVAVAITVAVAVGVLVAVTVALAVAAAERLVVVNGVQARRHQTP